MNLSLNGYKRYERRRRHRAARSGQRLDIQGLRAVAVLTVLANHLWGWPDGGFVGVDVFFVISGFLITGNLIKQAETTGRISFRKFYWNRIRRIVPAATVVLLLTCAAAAVVFLPFRSRQVGFDALSAFFFLSNWRFAVQGTDYFEADNAVSPIRHFWSLSIEEQFYFIWPALIALVCAVVLRRSWTHIRRLQLAGGLMGGIVCASFAWAIYKTIHSPTWAYFDTVARVWELGVGALLAAATGLFVRLRKGFRPLLSWAGLVCIGSSLLLVTESSTGFPAPWALLPVTGAALVIISGVGQEPGKQFLLRNPLSCYVGNISYSLYLVHWPLIVIVGSLMEPGLTFTLVILTSAAGLSIASYHFVETPLRHVDSTAIRNAVHAIKTRRFAPSASTQYAAIASLVLLTLSLVGFAQKSPVMTSPLPAVSAATNGDLPAGKTLGPLTRELQDQIVAALGAAEWPMLDPPMADAIQDAPARPVDRRCAGKVLPDPALCVWGSDAAPIKAVLVGSSIGMTYSGPLREIAENSNGQFQLRSEAMAGCTFTNELITNGDEGIADTCASRKQHAIDLINATRPQIVFVSNAYTKFTVDGTDDILSVGEWADSMREILAKFGGSGATVVFLSPPPADIDIGECFSTRRSVPADCVSRVTDDWYSMSRAERDLATSIGGIWIDSRPWFCNIEGELCPSFVGSTPTKVDRVHMSPDYGSKISGAIAESFRQLGVL